MHNLGLGLFEEIALLRKFLRAAHCGHGQPLSGPCSTQDCLWNEARRELDQEPGAKVLEAVRRG